MSRDEYIIYLADKVASGEIDFNRIRRELERHGLNEVHTTSMIRLIDREVLSRSVAGAKRKQRRSYLLVGILMTIAGLISTILLTGFGPVVYFIGYGPFATGLGIIVTARRTNLRTIGSRSRRVATSFRNRLYV